MTSGLTSTYKEAGSFGPCTRLPSDSDSDFNNDKWVLWRIQEAIIRLRLWFWHQRGVPSMQQKGKGEKTSWETQAEEYRECEYNDAMYRNDTQVMTINLTYRYDKTAWTMTRLWMTWHDWTMNDHDYRAIEYPTNTTKGHQVSNKYK